MQFYQQENKKYRIIPSHTHDLVYCKAPLSDFGNKVVLNQE